MIPFSLGVFFGLVLACLALAGGVYLCLRWAFR